MSTQTMLLLPLLLVIGGLYHIVPVLTRPDLFFAVTVAPEFRGSADARRILGKYRTRVWIATLLAGALVLVAGMAVAAVLLQLLGFLWGLVSARGEVWKFAATPDSLREVDLAAPEERLPGGPIVALVPVVFLAGIGVWASYHWDRLPPRFPVHWGVSGADRWVNTTPATVFGFLAAQAFVCLLMAASAWGILNWSRRISTTGAGAAAERHFRRRIVQLLIVCEYFLACPAWFALFYPAAAATDVWALAMMAVIVALSVNLVRGGQGGSRGTPVADTPPAGDRTPDACWKWGIVYVNAADPAILIEKRFGIGYTLNFGNRWTWVVLALVLVGLSGLVWLR